MTASGKGVTARKGLKGGKKGKDDLGAKGQGKGKSAGKSPGGKAMSPAGKASSKGPPGKSGGKSPGARAVSPAGKASSKGRAASPAGKASSKGPARRATSPAAKATPAGKASGKGPVRRATSPGGKASSKGSPGKSAGKSQKAASASPNNRGGSKGAGAPPSPKNRGSKGSASPSRGSKGAGKAAGKAAKAAKQQKQHDIQIDSPQIRAMAATFSHKSRVEAAGRHCEVRKHSGTGCAVVSMESEVARAAVMTAIPFVYRYDKQDERAELHIDGHSVQVRRQAEKSTHHTDLKTDIFVGWGHQAEKLNPLSCDSIAEFFDQLYEKGSLSGGKMGSANASPFFPGQLGQIADIPSWVNNSDNYQNYGQYYQMYPAWQGYNQNYSNDWNYNYKAMPIVNPSSGQQVAGQSSTGTPVSSPIGSPSFWAYSSEGHKKLDIVDPASGEKVDTKIWTPPQNTKSFQIVDPATGSCLKDP